MNGICILIKLLAYTLIQNIIHNCYRKLKYICNLSLVIGELRFHSIIFRNHIFRHFFINFWLLLIRREDVAYCKLVVLRPSRLGIVLVVGTAPYWLRRDEWVALSVGLAAVVAVFDAGALASTKTGIGTGVEVGVCLVGFLLDDWVLEDGVPILECFI